MKEERFIKFTYIHDIATVVSILLSVFSVIRGTGSKVRDIVCGSFLVSQIWAAVKIVARFRKGKNDLAESAKSLYRRFEKEWGGGWKPLLPLYAMVLTSVFVKVGVPLLLRKDD